jgi:hypothetical protein
LRRWHGATSSASYWNSTRPISPCHPANRLRCRFAPIYDTFYPASMGGYLGRDSFTLAHKVVGCHIAQLYGLIFPIPLAIVLLPFIWLPRYASFQFHLATKFTTHLEGTSSRHTPCNRRSGNFPIQEGFTRLYLPSLL